MPNYFLPPGPCRVIAPLVLLIFLFTASHLPLHATGPIMPGDLKEGDIFEVYQNENYSFFLTKRGVVRSLQDSSQVVLFDQVGNWLIQGAERGVDSKISYRYVDSPGEAKINKTTDTDKNTVYEIDQIQHFTSISWKLVCLPHALRISGSVAITSALPDGVDMIFKVRTVAPCDSLSEEPKVITTSPIPLGFKSGRILLDFDGKLAAWQSPTKSFFLAGPDPQGDESIWCYLNFGGLKKIGATDTLNLNFDFSQYAVHH